MTERASSITTDAAAQMGSAHPAFGREGPPSLANLREDYDR